LIASTEGTKFFRQVGQSDVETQAFNTLFNDATGINSQLSAAHQMAKSVDGRFTALDTQAKQMMPSTYKSHFIYNQDIVNGLQAMGVQPAESRTEMANAAQKANQSSGGPAVGTIERGYRFKGGDPSDQSSWEKAE
jgi:hypothetical protein